MMILLFILASRKVWFVLVVVVDYDIVVRPGIQESLLLLLLLLLLIMILLFVLASRKACFVVVDDDIVVHPGIQESLSCCC